MPPAIFPSLLDKQLQIYFVIASPTTSSRVPFDSQQSDHVPIEFRKQRALQYNILREVLISAAADIVISTTCKFSFPFTSHGCNYNLDKNTLII